MRVSCIPEAPDIVKIGTEFQSGRRTWKTNLTLPVPVAQIDAIVQQISSATTAIKPDLLVSAAVWPNYTSGYNSYYQDSKGWLAHGFIDANMPMLYSSDILNDLPAWTSRAQGFIDDAYGRYVFPGISTNYTDVNQLLDRTRATRVAALLPLRYTISFRFLGDFDPCLICFAAGRRLYAICSARF